MYRVEPQAEMIVTGRKLSLKVIAKVGRMTQIIWLPKNANPCQVLQTMATPGSERCTKASPTAVAVFVLMSQYDLKRDVWETFTRFINNKVGEEAELNRIKKGQNATISLRASSFQLRDSGEIKSGNFCGFGD